ncbi:MAG TPA: Wadjet anti-phage system protein JetD domain-containing protein [Candidatus Angelobacter sp.]|nr:Wadjet anti-phage system protein JetD domain-containing protein [Candidatus Angelobacter sp.]
MPAAPQLRDAIARKYERLQAGRTGRASRDTLISLEELLREADCHEGEQRAAAERELVELQRIGALALEPVHNRDRCNVGWIRFSLANESAFYQQLGRPSPTEIRAALATQFATAVAVEVPERWREGWRKWCERLREAAASGRSVQPFDRHPSRDNAELLALLPKLLAWDGDSLVRFASCVLCGDSKRLETLGPLERNGEFSGQLRGKLGRLLSDITNGEIETLDDLGIIPNPRFALVHGPLLLRRGGDCIDLTRLLGPFRLSQIDIENSGEVNTTAKRCLTIENETTFHELAKLRSGELLVQTSFPGSGTLALLRRLPESLEFWHFGDSDGAGFEILDVLRARTGRDLRPLHMQRGRIPAEQEALGRPTRRTWPFYD